MWNNLDYQEKKEYIEYCNDKYGKTKVFSETGEPLYFDKKANMINTKIIISLLFGASKN